MQDSGSSCLVASIISVKQKQGCLLGEKGTSRGFATAVQGAAEGQIKGLRTT